VISGRQADRLGDRLRTADVPDPVDLEMLGAVVLEYDPALNDVARQLREIGLTPTARLKTSGTIIEKLKRPPNLRLRAIHDIAGARVVKRISLDEQDDLVAEILEIWPDAEVIDRRTRPSHGYRAVHLIPRVRSKPVEIQVRTFFQDTWAQVMELMGDRWGREIRYGGQPADPESRDRGLTSLTRVEIVASWKEFAEQLHDQAQVENVLVRVRSGRLDLSPAELQDLEEKERQFVDTKATLHDLRRELGLHTDDEQ
jgi:ppGpp synthetase/RelA/SpoT-type nucleotidyltranferase